MLLPLKRIFFFYAVVYTLVAALHLLHGYIDLPLGACLVAD